MIGHQVLVLKEEIKNIWICHQKRKDIWKGIIVGRRKGRNAKEVKELVKGVMHIVGRGNIVHAILINISVVGLDVVILLEEAGKDIGVST